MRDRWLEIKELESKYNPTPYHNKDSDTKHIRRQDRAQQTLSAQQQLASRQALQPVEAAQQYGAGVTSLISGYPGREVITAEAAAPSSLATGLGTASTLAGIYRLIQGSK